MYNIDYNLIGSIPKMEVFKNSIDSMIVEYEAGRQEILDFKKRINAARSQKEVMAIIDESLAKPQNRAALGFTIEMCAQHFYGIPIGATDSVSELIDLIKSIEQSQRFK